MIPDWLFIWFVFNGLMSYLGMCVADANPHLRTKDQRASRFEIARMPAMPMTVVTFFLIGGVVMTIGFLRGYRSKK